MAPDAEQVKRAGKTAKDKGEQAGSKVQDRAGEVEQSRGYRILVRVGLVSLGLVYVLIGAIAVQVALGGGGGGDADQEGALKKLADQPFGWVVLLVVGLGLIALVVWQVIEAIAGHKDLEGGKRTRKRLSSAGRAIVYGGLALSAGKILFGKNSESNTEEKASGSLLSLPLGQVLVGVLALVVIGYGIHQAYRGISGKFTEDLSGTVTGAGKAFGVVGHVAKGLAMVVVGVLFGWAALSGDAQQAGGMDKALTVVRDQPFGTILLIVLGLGLACFGAYCFWWSTRPKHSAS